MKIKIGKDIKGLEWSFLRGADPFDWSLAQNIVVYALQPKRPAIHITPLSQRINGNIIELSFLSSDCPIGDYNIRADFQIPDITLPGGVVNDSQDWANAFSVVEHSYQEDLTGATFTTVLKWGINGLDADLAWLKANPDKTYADYIAMLRQPATEAATLATDAAALATEVAQHPTYIGQDHYVYEWNSETKTYNKTDIYCKGDAFSIAKTYASVALMQADFDGQDTKRGDFVLIESGNVEDPDNSKLYVKGMTAWGYLSDLSGAIGFTGKTPQISIGTVTTGEAGSPAVATLSEDGVDASGNPKFKLNFSIPKGDQGIQGIQGIQGETGKSSYQYYLEHTTDVEKLTEEQFGILHGQIPANETLRQQQETARVQAEIDRVNSGAALVTDVRNIQPAIPFFKRVIADGGLVGDKTILAKLFTDKLKSLATTQVLFMPHLGLKERTSGVNKYASKVYDAGLINIDAIQATEATQPYIGGFIAPNSLKGLKYCQGQTQTGEVAFIGKSYLATDSWSLTIVLKANKRSARILLGANSYLEIGASTITLHNGTAAILTTTYSYDCGKTTIIGFHYSKGLGLIKVDGVPLTTTVTSGAIAFSKLAYSSANPFDGLIYYFHLQNERISEAESQQNYTLLRALFPEIEGIEIGNQFWASSNYEGTVAGDGTVIPEVQGATIDGNPELITNAEDREFSNDTGWWTKRGEAIISGGTCNIISSEGAESYIQRALLLTVGKRYRFIYDIVYNSAGTLKLDGQGLLIDSTVGASKVMYFVAISSAFIINRYSGVTNIKLDNASLKEVGWSDLTSPAFCYYNNSPANGAVYGKLYNWYAVELLSKYPPKGWRVPSRADVEQLITNQGGSTIAGGKFKAKFSEFNNAYATNESGFSAAPSGRRNSVGGYELQGVYTGFYYLNGGATNGVRLDKDTLNVLQTLYSNNTGFSLRLLRNSPVGEQRKQVESGYFTTDITSAAKSIAIPFGYVVKEIRITTTTSVTSIEAKLHNTAGTAVATLITGKACNSKSITFDVGVDQEALLQDGTVRVTAAGNNATSIGMNIVIICNKIEL